jgi:ribosomal protein S18 acetylase RimI-like enzyme
VLDGATLLRAAAANHRAWFRRRAALAGGRVEHCEGLDLVVDSGGGTIAFPRPGARSPEAIDGVMRRARKLRLRAMSCWSLHEDRTLGTLLLARGFEWGWQPHWMAIGLARLPDVQLEHAVVPAEDGRSPGVPYATSRPDPEAAWRLAVRARNQTVGHAVVNPWRGYAGIYDMGVHPSRRRRGIGRALTLAACRLGRELGCTHAVLNATGEGEPLYRAVGFESLGMGRTWWLHPGRRPTARQKALVEAIGFGDLEELASLRPTRAELERPVPGAGPPLAAAVVTGQADVADWILERRPDLVSRPVEPRGGTLLHEAVEWDDERLARVALARGADRTVRDGTWNSTPLDWAEHLGRPKLAALLRG